MFPVTINSKFFNEERRGGVSLPVTRDFVNFLKETKERENLSWLQFDAKYGVSKSTWHSWNCRCDEGVLAESEVLLTICRRLYHHLGVRPNQLGLNPDTCTTLDNLGLKQGTLERFEKASPFKEKTAAAETGKFLPDSIRFIGTVPTLRTVLRGRERDLALLKGRLFEKPKYEGNILIVIHGWPGIGKTSFATALANNPEIRTAFGDRILWASLGQEPSLLGILDQWHREVVGTALSPDSDLIEARRQVYRSLFGGKSLIVLDDVWFAHHANCLILGGPNCAILITTRLPEVAEELAPRPGTDIYLLPKLSDEPSLQLLADFVPGMVAENSQECIDLVHAVEGLPLSLKVAGAMLREGFRTGLSAKKLLLDLQDTSRLLQEKVPSDLVPFFVQTRPTVVALLQRSTESLDSETRFRFAALGPLAPKPAVFPLKYMANQWQVSDPAPIAKILIDRGLLEYSGEGYYQIHDLMVQFARYLIKTFDYHRK